MQPVMRPVCIVYVMFVLLKRWGCHCCVCWGCGSSTSLLCTGKTVNGRYGKGMENAARRKGLESALCSRCMCLIRAFTHYGSFPVHPSTPSFSSQVRKKGLVGACVRCSVIVGSLETLGLVLRCAVAIQSSHSPAGNKGSCAFVSPIETGSRSHNHQSASARIGEDRTSFLCKMLTTRRALNTQVQPLQALSQKSASASLSRHSSLLVLCSLVLSQGGQ